jgi:PRTRC genetic system protein E
MNNTISGLNPQIKESFVKAKEFVKKHPQLQKMISSNKTDNMDFFQQLAGMESVDLTIRIFKKNDKFTLNIMPGSGNSTNLPILVTGTAAELDGQFFEIIMPQMKEISGLITNLAEVAKELKEKPVATPKVEKGKPAEKEKPAAEKKVEKQVEPKANLKPTEPDLFGAIAEPAAVAPVLEEVKEEEEESSE